MGDSDDDYNSSVQSSNNPNLNSNAVGNSSSGGGGSFNSNNGNSSLNNNNNKKNRDKFYRERDETTSNNNSNNYNSSSNYNNGNKSNDSRRDWNNDRNRSSGDWKSRNTNNMGSGGGGYGNASGGSYQRMQQGSGSSDYPRKYSQHQNQNSPGGNYDTSPPPHKRNKKDWDMDQVYGGSSNRDYHSRSQHSDSRGSGSYHQSPNVSSQTESEYPTQPPFLSFKVFLQQQDDNISDEEAIRKYNEYKIEFKRTQINNFFLEHKEEEWFKSRYHPDECPKRRREHNQFVLSRLEAFDALWRAGWLDEVACEYDRQKELVRFLDAFVIKLEGGTDQDIREQLDGTKAAKTDGEDAGKVKDDDDDDDVDGEKPAAAAAEDDDEAIKSEQPATNGNANGNEASKSGKRKAAEDSGSESGAYTEDDDNDDNDNEKASKSKKSSNGKKKASQQQPPVASTTITATATNTKQLHRTSSIFMRNLAPAVTKQDLETLCKTLDGFKRVALSDPAPERGFFRRGWITFEPHVDVKKSVLVSAEHQDQRVQPGRDR